MKRRELPAGGDSPEDRERRSLRGHLAEAHRMEPQCFGLCDVFFFFKSFFHFLKNISKGQTGCFSGSKKLEQAEGSSKPPQGL